jgi:hypothetical protein
VLVDALGRPVRPELCFDRFRKLCREAGLRTIHLHLVRHTLANALNRADVALVDAAPCWGTRRTSTSAPYLRKSEAMFGPLPVLLEPLSQVGSEMNLEQCHIRNFGQHFHNPRNMASTGVLLSGWRDLNSRPLDPQIGSPRLSSVNHCSLASTVDR